MSSKLISVVIPVYNTGKFLIKCVISILNQSYQHLEIILVDDGSELETCRLCDELALLDQRIRVVHQTNGGLSVARNTGIDLSTGDYITFVDSDDYISPTMYEDLLVLAENGTLPTSHYVRVDELENIYERNDPYMSTKSLTVEAFVESLLLHKGDVSVCTKLFSRDQIGHTRFITGKTNEDLLFMIELLKNIKEIRFTNKIGYYYLKRSGSLSSGYGKAVIDMLENSNIVKSEVLKYWPNLKKQAWRFVLYQHMAYMLITPISEIKGNAIYNKALALLRSEVISKGLLNCYLNIKQKIIISCVCCLPKTTAKMFQIRRKK